jgi:sulfur carrier protein ThiS
MKVQVRLFGTLGNDYPGHDPLNGFEVELHENATVKDLVEHLRIPASKVGMVTVNRQLVRSDHSLRPEDAVRLFRPIFGG